MFPRLPFFPKQPLRLALLYVAFCWGAGGFTASAFAQTPAQSNTETESQVPNTPEADTQPASPTQLSEIPQNPNAPDLNQMILGRWKGSQSLTEYNPDGTYSVSNGRNVIWGNWEIENNILYKSLESGPWNQFQIIYIGANVYKLKDLQNGRTSEKRRSVDSKE